MCAKPITKDTESVYSMDLGTNINVIEYSTSICAY